MGLPGDQPRCTTQPTDPSGALLLSGAFGALHPHKARCGGKKGFRSRGFPRKGIHAAVLDFMQDYSSHNS